MKFFCPMLGDNISQYDCDEITCAASNNYLFNDGVPPLIELEAIKNNRALCIECEHCAQHIKELVRAQIGKESNSFKKMSKDEIRKRLSNRASEFLMFKDD